MNMAMAITARSGGIPNGSIWIRRLRILILFERSDRAIVSVSLPIGSHSLDASRTSYHDAAPLGMELVYKLKAFNTNGVALRLSTNVPACK